MDDQGGARWRDEPVVPENYQDVRELVRLAREARHRVVEFDWRFSRPELHQLRRAVLEWGTTVRGRFKAFDSRVLKAIEEGLQETDAIYRLSEPTNAGDHEIEVRCVPEGDDFRLRGHAPFDVIYGYGQAGVSTDPETAGRLSSETRQTLAASVRMLGWDLEKLQEPRLAAVTNAMFGLPLSYGTTQSASADQPATDLPLRFRGPYSIVEEGARRCLFGSDVETESGVYLWTILVNGESRVWYVGQTTRGFGTRTREHVIGFLSGDYDCYDAEALARGEYQTFPEFPESRSLPSLLANYERLVPNILRIVRMIDVHVIPLEPEGHLLNRIEGSIGRYFKSHSEESLRNFITPGLRLPGAVPGEAPLRLVLSSDSPIAGLPPHLIA